MPTFCGQVYKAIAVIDTVEAVSSLDNEEGKGVERTEETYGQGGTECTLAEMRQT